MAKKVAIIGGGISGLSLAARLSYKGYEVHLYDANSYPGGKLSEFYLGKFRFDAGPSLFTLPERMEELFTYCGKKTEQFFKYRKLDPVCHYYFNDGTDMVTPGDWEQLKRLLQNKFPEDAGVIDEQMKLNVLRYEKTRPVFLERPLNRIASYFNIDTLKAILAIPKLGLFQIMANEISLKFKNKNLQQYFMRFATYNGSNPYKAPAVLNLIQAVESYKGAYFPVGGMYAITQAVLNLAKENGCKIYLNTAVERIVMTDNKVKGIVVNGNEQKYDAVAYAGDVWNVYNKLLPELKAPKALFTQERSTSAIIFYWGMKKDFPQLLIHNVFFSNDYQKEFKTVFDEKLVADDPTIYIHISSKIEKKDAPENCSAWFVMVNAPPNTGQNWEQMRAAARKKVIEKVSKALGENIEELIVEEDYLDAIRLQERTSSFAGSIYGNSSNSKMAAFLRQSNKHNKVKGLYFCGGSVHPGGGVPISIHSARICADLIIENE